MNFTRWSARLPGTQRRAARGTEGSVPAARGEYAQQLGDLINEAAESAESADVPALEDFSVRELLGRLPGLVALVYGPEHRIAYVNDAYAAAFGPRPAGATVSDTCPEAEELGLRPLMDQVLRSGKPRTVKSRRTQDGGSYTVTCLPVDSPTSTVAGSSSTPPTSPTTPRPPSGCGPASAGTAKRPSPSSAPCSRRTSNSPTTCASPPPTSPAAPTRPSAATGTT